MEDSKNSPRPPFGCGMSSMFSRRNLFLRRSTSTKLITHSKKTSKLTGRRSTGSDHNSPIVPAELLSKPADPLPRSTGRKSEGTEHKSPLVPAERVPKSKDRKSSGSEHKSPIVPAELLPKSTGRKSTGTELNSPIVRAEVVPKSTGRKSTGSEHNFSIVPAELPTKSTGRKSTGSDYNSSLVPAEFPPKTAANDFPRTQPESTKVLPPTKTGPQKLESSKLVRVSSSNVMVHGNLGNIINNNSKNSPKRDMLDCLPKSAIELRGNGSLGNFVKSPGMDNSRAITRSLEPEELKEPGNEQYKNGKFVEALAYYDRAIKMDPLKASYHSNKAAALMAVGKIVEAVEECREAVRIQPSYYRAHHRLATLYVRLGEPEKAIHHFKLSKNEASSNDISRAQAIQANLAKSTHARKQKEYTTQLKESESAAISGSDSAPQVFALQAEALINLHRHEEAESVISNAPKFGVDESTKLFGAMENAYFNMVCAKVNMAAGRFEDAVAAAQRASQLDPSSREIAVLVRKTKAVASARSRGNELFKASRLAEACIAYGEGLNHDSQNAILLCNRAACHSKLGHYEKAIEDCDIALIVRPSYSKARLRRAFCNAKLERWAASIKDYEVLEKEIPGNDEVTNALSEARAQLMKQRRGRVEDSPLE